ncbi:MAG: polysaccharide deacetylase family protein [Phycisphaerae bacterium]|nr:polysaccharide deacetylase family protein [Phycisphaerae bacterium]
MRGALSLTFDDALPSQLEQGMPLLSRFAVHATFYVMPVEIRQQQDAWRQAVAVGHEIGSHTLTHPGTCNFRYFSLPNSLEEMTLEQIEAQITGSNAQIEELVGVRPVSFSYPCGQKFVGRGERVQSYVPLVARHYLTGRGWHEQYFNAPDRCDLAQLGGVKLDGVDFEHVRPQIAEAAQTGNWLVLAGHGIEANHPEAVKLSTLEAICAYCRDPANGIWIDTVGAIGACIRQTRGF